jgi:hypothetical protein
MKPKTTIATLAAVLALAGPAFSQANWGSTGAVTVALTLSYTDEALMLKDETGKVLTAANGGGPTFENTFMVETLAGPVDEKVPVKTVSTTEYGSKISVAKWGNVEIIKQLVQEEILPQKGKAPFIAGWSIIAIYGPDGIPLSYVARHTDKTTIDIPLIITPGTPMASAKAEKTVMTDNTPLVGEPTSTIVHTFSESYRGPGTASVPFLGGPLDVNGLLTGSTKIVLKTEGTGIDKIVTEVFVPGAIKLDKVLGTTELEDVVEGSISVAPGAVVNLDLFTPPVL